MDKLNDFVWIIISSIKFDPVQSLFIIWEL